MGKSLTFCLSVLACLNISAQSQVDSLKRELTKSIHDTTKVSIYLKFFRTDLFFSNPEQVIDYSYKAIDLSERIGFDIGEIEGHNNLGYTYRVRSEIDSALLHYDKAIELSNEVDYYKGLSSANMGMGNTLNQLGEWDEALVYFNKTIELAREQGDSVQMGSAYNNIGNSYLNRSIYKKALENYQKSAALGDEPIRETALVNIGVVHNMMGNYDEARKYFEKSLVYHESIGKKSHVAFINNSLGILEKNSGNFDKANSYYNDALTHYRSISDDYYTAETLQNLGNVFFEQKKYDQAISKYKESIQIQDKIDYPAGVCYANLAIGKAYLEKGEPLKSQTYMKQALDCATSLKLINYQSDANEVLAKIYEQQADYKNALAYQQQFKMLSDSINSVNSKEKIAELETQYQTAQKEQEIGVLSAQNEVANLRLDKQQNLRNILIIAAVLLILLIAAIYSRYNTKAKANRKLQELDTLKSNFFTNISHELRTPLTLILNPLDQLLNKNPDPEAKDNLLIAQRNASRLLELTDQLLELSKLEAGKLQLMVTEQGLIPTLKIIAASYHSLAESRNINFITEFKGDNESGFIDTDKIQKIVYNLLSNAFKFTSEGGTIEFKALVKNGILNLSVKDTGPGLSEEQAELIFDRFHQVPGQNETGGTGVGLTLTKELVLLHHGSIKVDSELGAGSEFIVSIPIEKESYSETEIAEKPLEIEKVIKPNHSFIDETELLISDDELIVLVVEDNDDMRNFIISLLKDNYKVIGCNNGKKGLSRALELIPDLIISDWMMPEMNGREFCQEIKKNEKTSHIPVILLTAKADIPSKIDGLQIGADDYLTKPFDNQELKVRVQNLIEQRQKLRERYSDMIYLEPSKLEITDPDKLFIEKAKVTAEKHLSNCEYTVEQFQKDMGMSRSQLHRKLKALLDQSASEFIRNMRLKRASELLSVNGIQVSEVAYQCGFNSLSYFTQCFREKYGTTPTNYSA